MTAIPVNLPVNFFSIGILIVALLIVYVIGQLVARSYVYFTPRTLASFIMVVALLFWTLPWVIMGNTLMIDVSAVLTVLLFVYTIWKVRRKRKMRKTSMAQANMGGTTR